MREFNFQKDGPSRRPNESEPRLTPGYKPGKHRKSPITHQQFFLRGDKKAAVTDELESEDDFQQDRDPRRGEERPGSSHGIAASDAHTGAQPGDQVHQGTVAPLPSFCATRRQTRLAPPSERARRVTRMTLGHVLFSSSSLSKSFKLVI